MPTPGNTPPRQLIPAVLWQALSAILQGSPYGFVLLAILEYYGVLKTGTAPNGAYLALLCAALALDSFFYYLVNRGAYVSAFTVAGNVCENGLLDLAAHMKNLPLALLGWYMIGRIGKKHPG